MTLEELVLMTKGLLVKVLVKIGDAVAGTGV
jgi:hypothetical protein